MIVIFGMHVLQQKKEMSKVLQRRWRKGKKVTQSGKLVAAHIPEATFDLLNLYALAYGIAKTDIIREQMSKWVKQVELEGQLTHIKMIVVTLQGKWYALKVRKYANLTPEQKAEKYNEWMDAVSEELREQGIREDFIRTIKNRMRQ